MAARLVQRCSRLLAVSRSPPPPPPAPARPPLRAPAPAPGSTLSAAGGGFPEKEPVFTPYPKRQPLDRLIETASSPEEVLQLVRCGHPPHRNQAALMLVRLSRLLAEKHQPAGPLAQDARFQELLNTVHSQISLVWNKTLVSLLRSLYSLRLPDDCKELRSVEQEVCWRLRRLQFRQLAFLAETSVPYLRERRSDLLAELLLHLERRWAEIDDRRTVVALLTRVGHLSEALMDRLEDKGLELVEQFRAEDLRNVLLALALQNRRSVPLLRAISYHLVQKPFTLSKSVLLDVAYAYGKLNFHQTQVFQKLAADLLPLVPGMSPNDVARCAKSFAFLKWLNLPLFEAFGQHVVARAGSFTPQQLCNVILAFARLNFQPEPQDPFFGVVHERLNPVLAELGPSLQVDLVWSLCVLQRVRGDQLAGVLAPRFHAQFLDGKSPQDQSTWQKLMHINATAQLEHPTYTGPFLPPPALRPPPSSSSSPSLLRKETPMQQELQETLRGLLGSGDKGRFAVMTQYGWELDAEVVLSQDNQPLPLKDLAAPHLAHPAGSQPLPPGAKRLAFLRWEFPNFNSRSKDLLGRFAMARRHVQGAGFLVVDVPYYEWLDLKSEWQKGAYLKDKMGKAVAEELAK
ncbi:FAST kinase domain-containing protein 4 [Tachyglossus aculeatus]|uniref:FAST kinase domain-containing protein 4 n=1 Tax=Tachyglossus aculeatus TaxID=9261 RepID=UPI0018F39271|nr:FAST kinase domain-containing protein 4 [Tachyglossus aculeatus]